MALPQWRGAGSSVAAPRLMNNPLFVGLRDSISKLSDQHQKRKDLEAKNKRLDAIRAHEEEIAKAAANQNHEWKVADANKQHEWNVEGREKDYKNSVALRGIDYANQVGLTNLKEGYNQLHRKEDRKFEKWKIETNHEYAKELQRRRIAAEKSLARLKKKLDSGKGAGVTDVRNLIVYEKKQISTDPNFGNPKDAMNNYVKKYGNKINEVKQQISMLPAAKKWLKDTGYTDEQYKKDINSPDEKKRRMAKSYETYSVYKDVSSPEELAKSLYKRYNIPSAPVKTVNTDKVDLKQTKANIANIAVGMNLKSPILKQINSMVDEVALKQLEGRDMAKNIENEVVKGNANDIGSAIRKYQDRGMTKQQIRTELVNDNYNASFINSALNKLNIK